MAEIKTNKAKIVKVNKEGLTQAGMPYKIFNLSEGHKQKDGTYKQIFFNCFVQGDDCKKVEEGLLITVEGSLTPNVYQGKDGKTVYGQSLYVKNIIADSFSKAKVPTKNEEGGEEVALPFD